MIGAGQTLGRFQAVLGLDATNYAKGIINANSLNKVFGETFTAFVSNPLLGGIQILKNFGTVVVRAAGQQLALAESLQRTAQATGASEQLLIALEKRLQVAGFNADIAAKALQKFGTELFNFQRGSGPLKEVADSMGLVLDASVPLETNLRTLLDAIAQLPNETQRSAAAAKVFGEEAGPKLLNAIGGGSAAINRMIRETQQLGFIVDKVGNDNIAAMNTQFGYLKLAVEGIKFNALQSFLSGLAGDSAAGVDSITRTAKAINDDLGPSLVKLGRETGPALKSLSEDLPGIVQGLADFAGALNAVGEAWDGSFGQIYQQFAINRSSDFFRLLFFRNSQSSGQQQTQREFNALNQSSSSVVPSMQFFSGF